MFVILVKVKHGFLGVISEVTGPVSYTIELMMVVVELSDDIRTMYGGVMMC